MEFKNNKYMNKNGKILDFRKNKSLDNKINKLSIWLNQTFNYGNPFEKNDNINKAYRIYNSEYKQDFIDLIGKIEEIWKKK